MRRLLRAVAWLCAAAALALILRTCVFGLVKVAGQSMENTLETGDVALVSRLDYRLGSIRRGDEVIVTTKKNAIFLEPKKK